MDHVGVGSDYALSNICVGVETADKLPNLAAVFRRRSYQEETLAKIMGGILVRLFGEVLSAQLCPRRMSCRSVEMMGASSDVQELRPTIAR